MDWVILAVHSGEAQAAYFATEEATEQEEWVAGSPEYGFNEYLQLGVELGIVGVSLFLLAVGLAVRRCSILPARKGGVREG